MAFFLVVIILAAAAPSLLVPIVVYRRQRQIPHLTFEQFDSQRHPLAPRELERTGELYCWWD